MSSSTKLTLVSGRGSRSGSGVVFRQTTRAKDKDETSLRLTQESDEAGEVASCRC